MGTINTFVIHLVQAATTSDFFVAIISRQDCKSEIPSANVAM